MADEYLINARLIWIKSHSDRQTTVDDVARKSGYTKWYLNRYFRKHTGKSIGVIIRTEK